MGGDVPDSYAEMSCDSCMKSHDFLHFYKQCTNPIKVSKEACEDESSSQTTESKSADLNVTETDSRNGESKKTTSDSIPTTDSAASNTQASSNGGPSCELERRRSLLPSCSEVTSNNGSPGAGFFDESWRSRLCHCDGCKQLYCSSGVEFLLEESDPVGVYEDKAERRPTTLDAGMAALGNSLDRVQQVEAFHREYIST